MASAKQMTNNAVGVVVAILVAAIMVAFVLPIAVNEINAVDTAGWGDAESSLFDLMPLFIVLVPLLVIIGWAVDAF